MTVSHIWQSFSAAGRGIRHVFKNESNFRFQILVGLLASVAVIWFPLKTWEVIVVILLIAMVLAMELLNSALERFADLLKPRLNEYVWIIKDIMAGAVLITSLGAATVGIIIFLPYFLQILK